MTTGPNGPSRGLAAANQVIRKAVDEARRRRQRRTVDRARVEAIDAVLEIIERRHLDGESTQTRMHATWRHMLEDAGLSIPADVLHAPTTLDLHERLLDWQDTVLDRRGRLRAEVRSGEDDRVALFSLMAMYPRADRRE
jgi:uncharacterized protein YhaN